MPINSEALYRGFKILHQGGIQKFRGDKYVVFNVTCKVNL